MYLKVSFAKWRPFCLGLIVFILTARDFRQSAMLNSDGTLHSKAPRPLSSIRITTIILGSTHAAVSEIGISSTMRMGRLWVPALTSIATDSHWDCARITIYIYVFTGALVWKKHFWFKLSCLSCLMYKQMFSASAKLCKAYYLMCQLYVSSGCHLRAFHQLYVY